MSFKMDVSAVWLTVIFLHNFSTAKNKLLCHIGNENVPKIIIHNTINLFV